MFGMNPGPKPRGPPNRGGGKGGTFGGGREKVPTDMSGRRFDMRGGICDPGKPPNGGWYPPAQNCYALYIHVSDVTHTHTTPCCP